MHIAARLRAEDGAVTTDWVVLTAAIIALAMSVTIFFGNARDVGTRVNDSLLTAELEPIGEL